MLHPVRFVGSSVYLATRLESLSIDTLNFGEVTLQQNGQVLGADLSQPPARDLYRIERLSKVNLGIIRNRYIEFELGD